MPKNPPTNTAPLPLLPSSDRPEVRAWQARVLKAAHATHATRTLIGRYRDLPDINSPEVWVRRHAERAAINTPIQGGAADIVMLAMLKLHRNAQLRALGWRMLLQVRSAKGGEGGAHRLRIPSPSCIPRRSTTRSSWRGLRRPPRPPLLSSSVTCRTPLTGRCS